ncbi:DUF5712 family protein [Pedobacter aquatilis]|uniref:DUF5712 family protein n=1 Tax=Pedobacter aquatilis TaxID=351343 RepID=UPI00292ECC7D|nr:DUF5712 family protein [Pedobacter aquatilis]
MFINITASETGNSKGSSGALVNYLEKENHIQNGKGKGLSQENWFNGIDNEIPRQEVKIRIDRNIAKLSHDDSKFFLINLSPSQKELAHLYQAYGEKDAKEKLKEFAVAIMDEYAKNFKRKGVDSNKDLLWYAKHENYRYYKYNDNEVKSGEKQIGERKKGKQNHIQIIVSRKDITNKIKLSPQNTSRGKNKEHSEKLGQFDRSAFKQSGEALFDKMFNFERQLDEKFLFSNIMDKGSAVQKAQLSLLNKIEPDKKNYLAFENVLKGVSDNMYPEVINIITAAQHLGIGLLEVLMEPSHVQQGSDSVEQAENRKKKKKRQKSRGISR